MSPTLELDETGIWYGTEQGKTLGFQNLSVGPRGAEDLKRIYKEAADKLGITVEKVKWD